MKHVLFAVVIAMMWPLAAAASTPEDYSKRIANAIAALDEMIENAPAADAGFERRHLANIREAVPPTEKVAWPGGSVETRNEWLDAYLSQYADETDAAKRTEILVSTRGRLASLAVSVNELKAAAATTTKDEDKRKLAEILRRPEYQPAEVKEESLFQRLWRKFWDWIDELFPRPNVLPSSELGLGSLRAVIQVAIIVLAIAVIAFVLWRFAPYFSARFGRRQKRDTDDRVILGEKISADESSADIFAEAERLARSEEHTSELQSH